MKPIRRSRYNSIISNPGKSEGKVREHLVIRPLRRKNTICLGGSYGCGMNLGVTIHKINFYQNKCLLLSVYVAIDLPNGIH